MSCADLILKRDGNYRSGEGYLLYFDGRCVGRIFDAGAKQGAPSRHALVLEP
jgi:hypothetical protein